MKDLGPLNILRLPLQVLWEFPDIALKIRQDSPSLAADFTAWFSSYDAAVQQQLLAQLKWAIAHPTYDFKAILKNVKTPNEDILLFFTFINGVFTQAAQPE